MKDKSKYKISQTDLKLLNFQNLDKNKNRNTLKNEFPFSKKDLETQLMRLRKFKKNKQNLELKNSETERKIFDFEENLKDLFINDDTESENENEDVDLLNNSDDNQKDSRDKSILNIHKTNKSFCNDSGDNLDYSKYEYLSESEKRKNSAEEKIKKYNSSLFDLFLHFSQINISHITSQIKHKNSKCSKEHREPEEMDMKLLIDKYNYIRNSNIKNEYSVQIRKKKKKKKNKLDLSINKAAILIRKFLEHLNILKLEKDQNLNHYQIDKGKSISNKFILKNIKSVENIYYKIDHDVEKFLPDLILMNIPKIIEEYPLINRMDLYKLFIEYKTLLKISIATNNSMKIMKKGIDFETFFNTVPNMRIYGRGMALDLFKEMNERKTQHLEWDEYLRGMIHLKLKKIEINENAVCKNK